MAILDLIADYRRSRIGLGVGASLIALTAAAPSFAQEGANDEPIVVTGTRLQRADLTATSPVSVVSEDQIRLSGNGTIEQTLNELPQLKAQGGATAGNTNAAGIYTADMRGLGPSRTLVLVNGRRFVPVNPDLLVDLSTIPEALVKRVEVVTGGASAVYGSDAVAGVVNFILDDKFEGIEADYSFAVTERGDGQRHKASVTLGGNFADNRGNVVASLAYHRQSAISAGDREFSRTALVESGDELVPGGGTQIPGSYLGLSSAQRERLVGVDLAGANCSVTGVRFDSTGAAQPFCNPEDLYNFGSDNLLMRPQERYQLTVVGHYDLTDSITAYAEGFFVDNLNSFQIAPVAFRAQNGRSGQLEIPGAANNPALSVATREFLTANAWLFDPDGDGTYTLTNVLTRPIELGPRSFDFRRKSYQGTLGLKGKFVIGQRDWAWDAYYSHQSVSQFRAAYGTVSSDRLALGLDVVIDPDTGEAVCRTQTMGCVPVNIFGVGSVSPEAAAFISPAATAATEVTRDLAAATVSGSLFDLPAGPVAVAFGIEYRKESFTFKPDAQVAAGQLSANVPNPPNSGDVDVFEQYGEIRIPLLADRPFFHDLSLEGAVRFSHYSSIGSTFAYKLGGQWAVTPWLRLRGAYQQSVRAPSLADLFENAGSVSSSGTDPCDYRRAPSAAAKAFCVAQGIPAADIDTFVQVGTNMNVMDGGNPNLQEENSDTYTVGIVLTPPFARRLNITADFYDIAVDNAISNVSAQATIDQCFQALDPSNPFCQRISRFPNGDIATIQTTLMNVASRKVRGIDFQIDYHLPLQGGLSLFGDTGSLVLRFAGNRQFDDTTVPLPGSEPIACSGRFGPGCTGVGSWISQAFKAQVSATYSSGPLSVTARGRYLSPITLREGQTAYRDQFPAESYFDLALRVELTDSLSLYGGVNNLFDNAPPLLGTRMGGPVNTAEATYDVLGRRYFAGINVKF
ncbi:TonB-dependent receptor [Tsuneonella flava]|uniref:TonB-dependent receptor n=1 Tax=Tsuneonella flava TaxID=2055955 RepID=A0ABX7KAP7_9SPHN|nr:TonB-dependent receptor [Tsuneonella flava]QSB45336.1 TonB-dependent receptor [Tsuneonella flava]